MCLRLAALRSQGWRRDSEGDRWGEGGASKGAPSARCFGSHWWLKGDLSAYRMRSAAAAKGPLAAPPAPPDGPRGSPAPPWSHPRAPA